MALNLCWTPVMDRRRNSFVPGAGLLTPELRRIVYRGPRRFLLRKLNSSIAAMSRRVSRIIRLISA